jgi:hypothetical protein
MLGALILPLVMTGITEASDTLRRSIPHVTAHVDHAVDG